MLKAKNCHLEFVVEFHLVKSFVYKNNLTPWYKECSNRRSYIESLLGNNIIVNIVFYYNHLECTQNAEVSQ